MSDRLTELRRQRALAQEQMAWFDREIARESGHVSPAATPPPSAATPAPSTPDSSSLPPETETLLSQYESSRTTIRSEVKRGCLIYFFAAFALLAFGVALFAFFWSRSHGYPMPWSDPAPASGQP